MVRLAHGLKEHDASQIESELKPKRAANLSFGGGGDGSSGDIYSIFVRYTYIVCVAKAKKPGNSGAAGPQHSAGRPMTAIGAPFCPVHCRTNKLITIIDRLTAY